MQSLELVTLKNLKFSTIPVADSLNIEFSQFYVFINYYHLSHLCILRVY